MPEHELDPRLDKFLNVAAEVVVWVVGYVYGAIAYSIAAWDKIRNRT